MIHREPLRVQIRDVIRNWIVEGRLSPTDRLTEPALAERLGVSRTPLREALLDLERDGFVLAEPGKGFRVIPLSIEMIHETYPILGALERLALRTCGSGAAQGCLELRRINNKIAESKSHPARQFKLDRRWHELLLQPCSNRRLLKMIRDLTEIIRRFDRALVRGVADLSSSCRQHAEILDALEAGDVTEAADRLEHHWVGCIEPVERWLRKHLGA